MSVYNSSVYRTNAAPENESAIVGGKLIRKHHENKTCSCKPPGWWFRLKNKVSYSDVWECPHGFRWEWNYTSWVSTSK